MPKQSLSQPVLNTHPNEHKRTDNPEHMAKKSKIKSPTHIVAGEYIKEWLVLGPFFDDDPEPDFLVDVGGEANIAPKEDDSLTTSDGRTLTWKRYQAKGNIVDLTDAIGNHEHAIAYALCFLRSDIATDARIYLGSDDGVVVWINGEQAHRNPAGVSPFPLDRDAFEVHLKAGVNHCLVKVSSGSQDWAFAVRMTMLPQNRAVLSGVITDESGQPIANADVSLVIQSQIRNLGSIQIRIPQRRKMAQVWKGRNQ